MSFLTTRAHTRLMKGLERDRALFDLAPRPTDTDTS